MTGIFTGMVLASMLWVGTATSVPTIPIDDVAFGRFGRSVTARFLVHVSPQAAYEVLSDHARFSEFIPMVAESTVVSTSPGHARVKFRIRYLRWFDIVEVDERTMEPNKRIRWQAVEGPLNVSQGSWTFEPSGSGTRITYQTDVDPGVPLPPQLVSYLVRSGVPDFLEAVRKRVESGGKWRKPAE